MANSDQTLEEKEEKVEKEECVRRNKKLIIDSLKPTTISSRVCTSFCSISQQAQLSCAGKSLEFWARGQLKWVFSFGGYRKRSGFMRSCEKVLNLMEKFEVIGVLGDMEKTQNSTLNGELKALYVTF